MTQSLPDPRQFLAQRSLPDPRAFLESRPTRRMTGSEASDILKDFVRDTPVSLARGAIGLGEQFVGLGSLIGRTLYGIDVSPVLKAVGYQPDVAKDALAEGAVGPGFSEAHNEALATAPKGFTATLKHGLANPSIPIQSAIESLPSMLGGGVIGRVAKGAPVLGAAIGEGLLDAGQTAEQTRQETGTLTNKQAAVSLTSGAVTGLISRAVGKFATRVGIADPDVLIAGGEKSSKAFLTRFLGSLATEPIEEIGQGATQKVAQNIANGLPFERWGEGVPEAAASGALPGAIISGAANLRGDRGRAGSVPLPPGGLRAPFARSYDPETAGAVDRLGLPDAPVSALSKSRGVARAEQYAATSISGLKLADQVQTFLEALELSKENLLKGLPATDPTVVGTLINQRVRKFRENFNKGKSDLYDKAKIPVRGLKIDVAEVSDFLDEVVAEKSAGAAVDLGAISALRDKLQHVEAQDVAPDTPFDGMQEAWRVRAIIKGLNEKVGEFSGDPQASGSPALNLKVRQMLSERLDEALAESDPELGLALQDANKFYGEGMEKMKLGLGDSYARLVDTPDKLVAALANPKTSVASIGPLREIVGEDTMNQIGGVIVAEILRKAVGVDKQLQPGAINRELKNWQGKIGEFLTPEQLQHLKDLGTVAQATSRSKTIAGGSQTFFMGNIAKLSVAAGMAVAGNLMEALKLIVGDLVVGKMLASKAGRKWLTTGFGPRAVAEYEAGPKAQGAQPPPPSPGSPSTPPGSPPGATEGPAPGFVSREAYEAAMKGLKDYIRGSTTNMFDNPVAFAKNAGNLAVVGTYLFEQGAKTFVEWSKRMISKFGPDIRPQLKSIWDSVTAGEESKSAIDVKTHKDGSVTVRGDAEEIRALLPPGVRGRQTNAGLVFSHTDGHRVQAAIEGRMHTYSREGRVVAPPMNDGKYIGAPESFNTPQKIPKLRKLMKQLTLEGESGRMWYENSSKAVLEFVGGNIEEAKKFVALLAIYSSQAKVDANATFALRAWAQYKAGQPINVKTGVQDQKAQEALEDMDKFWAGEKTGNFAMNLMSEIDPSFRDKQGATIDMWMMRAGGYLDTDSPTPTQYAFMENETNRIAKELGWSPHQVQAAIWVALKARMENDGVKAATEAKSAKRGWRAPDDKGNIKTVTGKEKEHRQNWLDHAFKHDVTKQDTETAAFDFSHATRRHIGQVSWEARPSTTLAILQGIHKAPYEEQVKFQQAIVKALRDEQGNDLLAMKLGLLQDRDIIAPGYWQDVISAGAQSEMAMAPNKGQDLKDQLKAQYGQADPSVNRIDPSQKKLFDIYSAVLGLLLRQDAVAYHRPFYDANQSANNGVELRIGKPFSPEQIAELTAALKARGVEAGIISSPNGVRVVNFYGNTYSKLKPGLGADALSLAEPVDGSLRPRLTGEAKPKKKKALNAAERKKQAEAAAARAERSRIATERFLSRPEDTDVANVGGMNYNEIFRKEVEEALEQGTSIDAEAHYFASDGNLVEASWKDGANGQDYVEKIRTAGRSDLLGWSRDILAPRVQAVFEEFSRYGWGDPGNIYTVFPPASTGQVAPSGAVARGRELSAKAKMSNKEN